MMAGGRGAAKSNDTKATLITLLGARLRMLVALEQTSLSRCFGTLSQTMKFTPLADSSYVDKRVRVLPSVCAFRPRPQDGARDQIHTLGNIETAMKKSTLGTIAVAAALLLILLVPAAGAATLQYSFSGVGSGSLAGQLFDESAFIIVGRGDPTQIDSCLLGCRFLDFESASVSIEGLGSFAILSPTRVFNNRGNLGLSRAGADGLDLYSAFLVPELYDFASNLGPVNGLVAFLQWQGNGIDDVLTSGGVLVFNEGDTEGSFRAQAVPVPGAAWLLGSALGAGVLIRRRRG